MEVEGYGVYVVRKEEKEEMEATGYYKRDGNTVEVGIVVSMSTRDIREIGKVITEFFEKAQFYGEEDDTFSVTIYNDNTVEFKEVIVIEDSEIDGAEEVRRFAEIVFSILS